MYGPQRHAFEIRQPKLSHISLHDHVGIEVNDATKVGEELCKVVPGVAIVVSAL